jgi:hypothetical protein
LKKLGAGHLEQGFPLTDQTYSHESDELDRINAELTASLKSCRAILRDGHAKLAANSNDPEVDDAEEPTELA